MKRILTTSTAFLFGLSLSIASAHAEKLLFVTEDYKPLNYYNDAKELVGLGAEQVKMVAEKAGIEFEIQVNQWSRSFSMAQRDKNVCVFTTSRTPDREALFNWVGPLEKSAVVAVKKAGSDITIASDEDLKKYKLGGIVKSVGSMTLESKGLKVDTAPHVNQAIQKLLAGRTDIVAMTGEAANLLKKDGKEIEIAYTLLETNYAIACNKGMPKENIDKLQAAMDDLIASGKQDEILAKYK